MVRTRRQFVPGARPDESDMLFGLPVSLVDRVSGPVRWHRRENRVLEMDRNHVVFDLGQPGAARRRCWTILADTIPNARYILRARFGGTFGGGVRAWDMPQRYT